MERLDTVVAKDVLAIAVKLTFAPTVVVPFNVTWVMISDFFGLD